MTTVDRVRVMYVVPDLRIGGAERHVTTLMPNLDERRFETAVVCIGEEGALFSDLAGSRTKAVALHRTKREAVRALLELIRQMRAFAPDVVITRGYNAETLGRIAARLTRVPRVVVWAHSAADGDSRSVINRLTDRVLDRVTDAYFGVAERQTDHLVDDLGYPRAKIRVIYNGVDPGTFDTGDDRSAVYDIGIRAEDKVVGILAALRPEKDHATFLRAARIVADRVPDAKFLIVGDGPERAAIKDFVDELGMRDRVVMAGSRTDVPKILQAIDVFVLSSYTVECFPMALLEAMAAGRPAVCTAVGGLPEMVHGGVTGYLVPPEDPVALADRLVDLLSDGSLAKQMGHAARLRVEEMFSLRTSVTAAERELLALVEPQRRSRPVRLAAVLDLTYVGGAEVLLLNLFKRLDPAVVSPRLICLREAGPLADEFRSAGVDVEVLHRSGRFDMRTLPRLIRSFRRMRTDAVLVTHHHRAALALGRIAARLARVPVNIVAAHDMDLVSVGSRVLPKWAVNTLALSDALVLLSPSQGAYLCTHEGVGRGVASSTREVVIPNGIELPAVPGSDDICAARKSLGLRETDFAVGIVARLSHQKAHEVLFHAVARCVDSVPNLRLVVIGDGERASELRELATEIGIASRTAFLGTRRDIRELLAGLDVACLSSVHEGVPIALIEAMAAGVPVVATHCGAINDIVEDGEQGYVVPVGDVDAFADRLATLAHSESLRRQLGKNGRARVEREMRIDITARGYEHLLEELVARKR